ncbi:MAG: FAD-dependent oxidoreductase [Lachnospiraceae bacterium]|nr:FAD-dependent oxidoreductase [Lachnospiraceae bacterium]
MLKINQIKLSVEENNIHGSKEEFKKRLIKAISLKIGIREDSINELEIVKRSIDARKKPEIYYVYSVLVKVKTFPKKILKNRDVTEIKEVRKYSFNEIGKEKLTNRPVVVGFGPAGMFCALMLAEYGYKPIVLERGMQVEERMEAIEKFWKEGVLNTESNVQFGEGGAGTFSDGKLNTSVNDKQLRNQFVLETFVRFGANEDILYDAKPHIGTDVLSKVVKNMREYIISKGGTVRFNALVTDFLIEDNCVKGVCINDSETLKTDVVVLAVGHSARDTFEKMYNLKFAMEPKPFAVGVRVEHRQSMIDNSMYGEGHSKLLPPSPYKLTGKTNDGRPVYSFCMCPGGYVVNASSEEGKIAVNGMSYNDRAGENANSAIVTAINPEDYDAKSPLDGMYFQRSLEESAYKEGNGLIPVQRLGDYNTNTVTVEFGKVKPNIKGRYNMADINNVFPEYINKAVKEAMEMFAKNIKGFNDEDTLISAVESRTSSPIRIKRNENYISKSHDGIYPCGEGAGYAGGITSAAIDGIKVFEAIASKYFNEF